MRLFLLPISTRRTLIYCDRVATQVNASGKLSYHDRIVNKANETWASWENSPNKYKKKLTDYGNVIFNRISYEEWGLKTLPSSTADLTPTEIVFPGRFLDQNKVPEILKRLATERQGLHKQRFWGSLIGLPFTIPVGLLPVIPNIPGLYLAFRAWSHFKADVMLLKRWNGKLLAEQFGLPGMELEIERAVEQVQKTIEIEGEKTDTSTTTEEQALSDGEKK
ncbi:hypothetical protein D6D02_05865 [Aureobasidium pullulans]|uniref:Uncharacterized protein n=1 Tax=Aureobasidium pullulans TaxID=5580 RepID=A0A4S8W3K9_AURPU|nr:hypothetical protein D6D23_07438 [Aureobasidium pullulans]THW46364.1 hypothetical protein D6D22_03112 [Aureobasidium pullulans]THY11259.1 hypothetical protein D6D02_05865 [Aureobasidium pullulans]